MVVVIITIAGQKVRGAKARQGKAIERTMRLALITAIMGMRRRRSSTPLIMLLIISIGLITLLILSTALIAALISRNGGA